MRISVFRASKASFGLSKASKRSFTQARSARSRRLCTKAEKQPKVETPKQEVPKQEPPAQEPPQESGGGGGIWFLVAAAVGAGGYYFREDIFAMFDSSEKSGNASETKTETKSILNLVQKSEPKVKIVPVITQPNPETANLSKEELRQRRKAAVEKTTKADWDAVREDLIELLDEPTEHDDGSYGPILVRLAWHSAGTYDKNTGRGGTEGAAMRYTPEANWGANAGLGLARSVLEPIKAKYPDITYSDLWSFAGTVAIEAMGGPEMKWRPGRADYEFAENELPDGLLPDADGREHTTEPAKHVRIIFNRMGFNDREMVALIGAHALGRCHTQSSGYTGPWTFAPTTFSNEYFRLLMEEEWTPKQWDGPLQFEDKTGELMMLPADMALKEDTKFAKISAEYAKDEDKFFNDFAKAWMKLQENGVKKFHGWRKYYLFGPRGE